MGKISISHGNSKMGDIPSVSLPAWTTCRECACWKKCYAKKLERIRKSVREAYQHNLEVLQNDPASYWQEVEAVIKVSRFFRFHVSGDIPSMEYLKKMVKLADDNPHCEILCFTKKYELVNEYIAPWAERLLPLEEILPSNLHLIFSGWKGLEMVNPYGLPEAHVLYRDGTTTAREDAHPCGGNCTECATTDSGCWVLKYGEQVVFHEH